MMPEYAISLDDLDGLLESSPLSSGMSQPAMFEMEVSMEKLSEVCPMKIIQQWRLSIAISDCIPVYIPILSWA
jgi:plasmid maintenance system killer protein